MPKKQGYENRNNCDNYEEGQSYITHLWLFKYDRSPTT